MTTLLGMMIFVCCLFISLVMQRNVIRTLSDEERLTLLKAGDNFIVKGMVPILLMGITIACMSFVSSFLILSAVPLLFIAGIIWKIWNSISYRKLIRSIGLPDNAFRQLAKAQKISDVGFVIGFLLIFVEGFFGTTIPI